MSEKGFTVVFTYRDVDLKARSLIGEMICPRCGKEMGIVGDQLQGTSSVGCPHHCGFHAYIKEYREWMPYRYVVRYQSV